MRYCHMLAVIGLLWICVALRAEPAMDTYALVSVSKLTGPQYHALLSFGFEIVERKGDTLEIIVPLSQINHLTDVDIPYDIVEPDLSAFYASRSAGKAMGGYRTLYDIEEFLDSLHTAKPSIVSPKLSIGQTWYFGLDLWYVKISDNPAIDEDEPEVLYISLIHSREPAGGEALLQVMKHFVANYGVDPLITELVNTRELYFIPCQNPDGYEWNAINNPNGGGMWRKNLRDNGDGSSGVDLNRNYGYAWGYDNIGSSPYTWSETFRGSAPFSEHETQAVRDFIISRDFRIIHNFHTFSNLVIWPWGYDYIFTDREDFFSNLGDTLTRYNNYNPGVSWTLYPTNGDADDWAWGDTISKPRIISLTVEIGNSSDGFWPAPNRIPTLVQENIFPNVFLAKIADNPYRIAPPTPPLLLPPVTGTNQVHLQWLPTDPANPADHYRLEQLTGRTRVADDAESDHGDWSIKRMLLSPARAYSGTHAWNTWTEDGTCHWLVLNTPYEVRPNDSLKFHMWYDIQEYFDYFYAEISTDGGFSYSSLQGNLTTNFNPYGQNRGNGITGMSGEWVEARFSLTPWTGQFVTIRLLYITDDYSHGEGVYIDDISFIDRYSSVATIDPDIADTTFSVSEAPGETAWYRVSATDAENQESRWSNIVASAQSYVVGDANASGGINVADLVYLVNNLYRGGPDPIPLLSGDVNCSGSLNIADVTGLVAYLYKGAPEPNCP